VPGRKHGAALQGKVRVEEIESFGVLEKAKRDKAE
jgi:hypothetical protein